jgi:three-Cys-motif partner protein
VTQQRLFGGDWTEEKLKRIEKYLRAYTTALSNQPFRTTYIDSFAGTGYRQMRREQAPLEPMLVDLTEQDTQTFLQGSVQIALQTTPRFSRYTFIEKDEKRFTELQKLIKDKFPALCASVDLVNDDCNVYLQDLCRRHDWQWERAVLFLDPFGMQVEWQTIEAIASTQAIDLWLLFPLGVAVNRLLRRDGQIDETLRKKLDTLFGTTEWFDVFYRLDTAQTLFGEETRLRKAVDLEQIGQYFVARLKTIFAGVAEEPLPLYNSRNNPLYLLCFAAGNPHGAPVAVKIAQHILHK